MRPKALVIPRRPLPGPGYYNEEPAKEKTLFRTSSPVYGSPKSHKKPVYVPAHEPGKYNNDKGFGVSAPAIPRIQPSKPEKPPPVPLDDNLDVVKAKKAIGPKIPVFKFAEEPFGAPEKNYYSAGN